MTRLPDRNIAVCRVGILDAIYFDWRAFTISRRRPTRVRQELRYIRDRIRERNWRAVRMSFSGFLAEHAYAGTRAGHGWTRRRALRDLHRHLAEEAAKGGTR